MKKRMTYSVKSKVLAFVLLCIFTGLLAASAAAIPVMWRLDLYDQSEWSAKNAAFNSIAVSDAEGLLNDYFNDREMFGKLADAYAAQNNAEYRVIRAISPDEPVWQSTGFYGAGDLPGYPLYEHKLTFVDMGDGYYSYTGNYRGDDDPVTVANTYYVEVQLDSFAVRDRYSVANTVIGLLFSFRYAVYVIAALSALGIIACYVFLMFSAGHREGRSELVPGYFYGVPFDVLAAAAAFAIFLLIYAYEDLIPRGGYLDVVSASVFCGAAALIFTWLSVSFSARVKLGGWWKNTLIFKILHLLYRGVAALLRVVCHALRSIPLVWKAALTMLVITVFELFLFFGSYYPGRQARLAVWLILRCLLFGAAIVFFSNLKRLRAAADEIAEGNADLTVDTKWMFREPKKHAEALNSISLGVNRAVEERLRSERLKTELITNVSHDIKTPLTSIINYVDILRKNDDPERVNEYLDVLDRQSKRLKKLTEDLVELSKAATGNVEIKSSRHSVNEMIRQAVGEYSDKLEARRITPVLTLPEEEIFAMLDGDLTWRVIDNLLSNACKYALEGTRLYVEVLRDAQNVKLVFKNVSRDALNIPAEELLERFVRGDAARTGEGSGLGLSIAQTLTQLQGGSFELLVDGDLFKAELAFPSC